MIKTPDNLTDRQLKFSYWYITHKLILRRALMIFLIVASVGLLAYAITELTLYALNYNAEDYHLRQGFFSQNQYLNNLEQGGPSPLALSAVNMMPGEANRNDFFAEVENQNSDWLAVFNYEFAVGRAAGDKKAGFVLPGEKKYLMGLGINSDASGLKISDLKWTKINDFALLKNQRLRLTVANEDLRAGVTAGEPNLVVFDITNDSAYNYWAVGLQVFLWSGSELVGINELTLSDFPAGETKNVQLNWLGLLPRVDNIEVIPNINILDESNIKPQ